ncbi:heterokaryon incompatibility protein-domain-containing protein [Xylogone sp. PMI_703]|nr:heterokaryon incompatibility protein-domain-containing protein [Xylogone sp. PMI_703]
MPRYEALSYTWSSSVDQLQIRVLDEEDAWLPVTVNLSSALRYLRHSKNPRSLWIDAICINQKDLQERQSQVQMMADIYQSANRVIVWLGPECDNSDLAMDILRQIGSTIQINERTQSPTSGKFSEGDASHLIPSLLSRYGEPGYTALNLLFSRP